MRTIRETGLKGICALNSLVCAGHGLLLFCRSLGGLWLHGDWAEGRHMLTEQQSYMQGMGGCYFAGAWAGYGFHEDGLKAGMAAAVALGAAIPWEPRATSPKLKMLDRLCLATFDRFARTALGVGRLRLILPTGEERCYGGGSGETEQTLKGASLNTVSALSAPTFKNPRGFMRTVLR